MEKLTPERIDCMSYAYFADEILFRYVSNPDEDTFSKQFFYSSHESNFSKALKRIKSFNPGQLFYMGAVNGVDNAFNDLANLPFQGAFLFGNKKQIAYLGLRLCLLDNIDSDIEYGLNMLCVDEEKRKDFLKKFNRPLKEGKPDVHDLQLDKLLKITEQIQLDPKKVVKQGERFMENLSYIKGYSDVEEIFLDPVFRKEAALSIIKYIIQMSDKEESSWFFWDNLKKLKDFTFIQRSPGDNFNRIKVKAFQADFYGQFLNIASELIRAYRMENLVINMSDLLENPEVNKKREDGLESIVRPISVFEPLSQELKKLWVIYSKSGLVNVIEHK